eukprot:SAG11_NODE_98_length_16927_cov_35.166211_19_plen_88_part_00
MISSDEWFANCAVARNMKLKTGTMLMSTVLVTPVRISSRPSPTISELPPVKYFPRPLDYVKNMITGAAQMVSYRPVSTMTFLSLFFF